MTFNFVIVVVRFTCKNKKVAKSNAFASTKERSENMKEKVEKTIGSTFKEFLQKFVSDVTSLGSLLNWKFFFGKIHGTASVAGHNRGDLKGGVKLNTGKTQNCSSYNICFHK